MIMAIFTEFYSFFLSYVSTLNFEEWLHLDFEDIWMAVYFIVFYNLTQDRPTLFKVFIVCCYVIISLLYYRPDRRTLLTMAIFISGWLVFMVCVFMVLIFVSYWYSSRKFRKNEQKVSSKFDLSARFESPENGRMRPMIISNININASSKDLKDFLLEDSSSFLPFKPNGRKPVAIEFSTSKPCQDTKTALLTIFHSHNTGGTSSVRGLALCILQKHNKEFQGRKLHIKELHGHKEIIQKHHKKWTYDSKKQVYKKGREDKLQLASVWPGYPGKTYTSVDGGSAVFDIDYIGDIVDIAKACGVEQIVIRCTSLTECYRARKLAELYPDYIYFTAGIHCSRTKVMKSELEILARLQELASSSNCIAIGECSLHVEDLSDKNDIHLKSVDIFKLQVELACKLQKPLFIKVLPFCGRSLLTILEGYRERLPKVLISANTQQMRQVLTKFAEMDFYFGMSGVSLTDTFDDKADHLKKGIIPMSRLILLSSIVPTYNLKMVMKKANQLQNIYLTEESIKYYNSKCGDGEEPEPCDIPVHIEMLSYHVNCPPNQTARILLENAKTFFNFNASH